MTAFFEKSYKNTRTIKTPDFDKKSGVFSNFWRYNAAPEKARWVSCGVSSEKRGFGKRSFFNFFTESFLPVDDVETVF